jgi:hypothetical protein
MLFFSWEYPPLVFVFLHYSGRKPGAEAPLGDVIFIKKRKTGKRQARGLLFPAYRSYFPDNQLIR